MKVIVMPIKCRKLFFIFGSILQFKNFVKEILSIDKRITPTRKWRLVLRASLQHTRETTNRELWRHFLHPYEEIRQFLHWDGERVDSMIA